MSVVKAASYKGKGFYLTMSLQKYQLLFINNNSHHIFLNASLLQFTKEYTIKAHLYQEE